VSLPNAQWEAHALAQCATEGLRACTYGLGVLPTTHAADVGTTPAKRTPVEAGERFLLRPHRASCTERHAAHTCRFVLAGIGSAVDTNIATADGAFAAVMCTARQLGLPSNFSVFVQGAGKVGSSLAASLVEMGATVYTADVVAERADIRGCTNVSHMKDPFRELEVSLSSSFCLFASRSQHRRHSTSICEGRRLPL
jgi:hypothetical protein